MPDVDSHVVIVLAKTPQPVGGREHGQHLVVGVKWSQLTSGRELLQPDYVFHQGFVFLR
jgi:hypothetical protein